MIVLPSASAGFQSSSLVGVNSLTINSPNSIVVFTLKANTVLTIANIVGANPSWADPLGGANDYLNFFPNDRFLTPTLTAVYADLGGGSIWISAADFSTDVTNIVISSENIYLSIQPYSIPATIPLLNGNLAINQRFA